MEAMWFGHTSCPALGPILGVDHHRDVLDEAVFLLAEDVGEVGPLLLRMRGNLTNQEQFLEDSTSYQERIDTRSSKKQLFNDFLAQITKASRH